MKIVSVVMNAATRDVRVVKAAKSLAAAGHEVRIVGIQDNNHKSPSVLLDGDLEVRRVDWRTPVYHRVGRIYTRLAIATTVVGVFGVAALLWFSRGLLSGAADLAKEFWAFKLAPPQDGGFWAALGGFFFVVIKVLIILIIVAFVAAVILIGLRRLARIARGGFVDRIGNVIAMRNASPGGPALQPARRPLWALVTGRPQRAFSEFFSLLNDRWFARAAKVARTDGMVELARLADAEVIHCHEVHALPAAVVLKQQTGAKIIYDAHELYEELAQASQRTLDDHRRIHEQCLPFVDGMVTVNDSIGVEYKRAYPFLPDPIIVKNATFFAPPPDYDGRLHEAANLDADQKILLYQGGFAKKRGLEELVRAARLLPENWSLVMMGWGAHEAALRKIADEGLREWITEAIHERRRSVLHELPDELREKIEQKIEENVINNAPATSAPMTRETGASALLSRFALQSALGDESEDPFTYEDDPAVAAQAEALNTLVNLRLNRMNIDDPLLEQGYKNIRFVPPAPQDELAQWTQGAEIGVIPYENDGLNHWFCSPNKLWEYPNAGVPILASAFPELHKTVVGNGIGWVLPPDPKATDIARSIARLTEPEIAEKKKACRDFIARDNWSIYEARLIELFELVNTQGSIRTKKRKSSSNQALKISDR